MNKHTTLELLPLTTRWKKCLESTEIRFRPATLKSLQVSINHFDKFSETYALTPILLTVSILSRYRSYLSELGLNKNTIYRHSKNLKLLQIIASNMNEILSNQNLYCANSYNK